MHVRSLLLSLLLSVFAGTLRKTVSCQTDPRSFASGITNPYLISPLQGGLTQYLVFHGQLRSSHATAHSRCVSLGGDLADVDSYTILDYLQQRLHEPAFIHSFVGHRYENCIAAYPGGAVAIPDAGCVGPMASICEIPVFGTASINVNPLMLNHTLNADNPAPQQNAGGLFRPNRKPSPIDGKALAQVISTVTVFGSIQTFDGPCCRCCN